MGYTNREEVIPFTATFYTYIIQYSKLVSYDVCLPTPLIFLINITLLVRSCDSSLKQNLETMNFVLHNCKEKHVCNVPGSNL
jgi:hypothetical protein